MIEFDESEYLKSPLEDWQLLLVLLMLGMEAKDKLLYEGEPHYGLVELSQRTMERVYETWGKPDSLGIGDGGPASGGVVSQLDPKEIAEALPP